MKVLIDTLIYIIGQTKTNAKNEQEEEEEKHAPKSRVSLSSDSEEERCLFTQNLYVTGRDCEVIYVLIQMLAFEHGILNLLSLEILCKV